MITVWISEIRSNGNLVIRKSQIKKELLQQLTTHIYIEGGTQIQKEQIMAQMWCLEEKIQEKDIVFSVPAPRLLTIVKELEKLLQIKFVEVKIRRGN